jgi:hypothetical protein
MEIHRNGRRTGAICALKQTIARCAAWNHGSCIPDQPRAVGEAAAKLPQRSRMRPCFLARSLRIKRGMAGCLPGLPGAPPTPGPQNPTSLQLPLSPSTHMITTCNAPRSKALLGCITPWANHQKLKKARLIFHIQFQNLTSFTLRRDQPSMSSTMPHVPTSPEAPGSRSK